MKVPQTSKPFQKFILHLHPYKIDERATHFTRTFGLGGMAALLFTMLFVSGMLLKFAYVPSAARAYDSLVDLQQNVVFGSFLRNLHYWSAMLLVVVTFLHVIRVFYSMAIFGNRRKNWIYGLLLLFLILASNFTGYLLPWDQLSYWAVTIVTNMLDYIPGMGSAIANLLRDGEEVGENTLLRFYHFHTGLLPLLMLVIMVIHFWLVRKAGGVALPATKERKMVDTHPHLTYKEALVALSVVIGLFVFSLLINAPLLDKAKPMLSPNPSKAPWYFMGFQELLINVHPLFGSFIIPLLITAFFIAIPFVRYKGLQSGQWFNSPKGKQVTVQSILFSVIFTFLFIVLNEKVFDFGNRWSDWPSIVATGILPTLFYWIPTSVFLGYLKMKKQCGKIELVIALVSILLSGYIVMMLNCWFLRGEGMQLIF